MPALTSAVPTLLRKTQPWRDNLAEMFGSKKAETEEFLKRVGIEKEPVCLQSTPIGDFPVTYIEGTEPQSVNAKIMASHHPYDKWFSEAVMTGLHGMDPSQVPPPPVEVALEWSFGKDTSQ